MAVQRLQKGDTVVVISGKDKGKTGKVMRLFKDVDKVIVDPYTIRLKTAAPYPNMPTDMAGLIIVSSKAAKGAVSSDFDSGKATIGTGPWKFDSLDPTSGMELSANPDWWGGKVEIKHISVKFFADETSMAVKASDDNEAATTDGGDTPDAPVSDDHSDDGTD